MRLGQTFAQWLGLPQRMHCPSSFCWLASMGSMRSCITFMGEEEVEVSNGLEDEEADVVVGM